MEAEDKDSKLGNRFEEAAKVFENFLTQVRNLQQEVTQRDDTIESLKTEINSLRTSMDENKEEMEEMRQQNKLLENQLKAAEREKNLRDSPALSKVQPSNNLNSSEHCCVNPHEHTRDYNHRNTECQELEELLISIAEESYHIRSRMETLERKEKDLERYIQQRSTNNPPSMSFYNCCGCIRNVSHHRFRAGGSSNYSYPSETTGESRPVSTRASSRQSSSSGIGTDTSDRSPRGTKRRFGEQDEETGEGSVGSAPEESSGPKKAREFPDNSPEPIDPPTCNASTPSQRSKQNPSTDGNNSGISDDTGEEFHGYPTPPKGEKTSTDYLRQRLSVSSDQRTSAEKPTVETLPVIVIDDSTVADVDTYSRFNDNAGPSGSRNRPDDDSDSESVCSSCCEDTRSSCCEETPPFNPSVKQNEKKGETPNRQKINTAVPVISDKVPAGKIRTRLKPFTPQ